MLKRILKVAMMTAIVCVLLAVNVAAAEYLNEDFENGLGAFTADTPPKGAARVEVTEGDNTAVFFDNTTDEVLLNRINASVQTLPGDGIMMFDYKKGEKIGDGYVYVELCRGSIDGVLAKSILNIAALSHEEGVWYSYIMTMSEDLKDSQVYRKKRDVDEPYAFVVNASYASTGESIAMWRMYSKKCSCYFDNVRIMDGVFAKDILFSLDGSEVSALEDITAGTFQAEMKIVCADVTKATDNGTTYYAKGSTATPVMVFFDKNMRMVGCTQAVKDLAVGDNDVTIEIDTTDFADKLDGGFAGLYVLDDMMNIRPLSDAVELR